MQGIWHITDAISNARRSLLDPPSVMVSVVESRMTEDCLHCRHVFRCSQHFRRERVPAAVGRTLLDTGLTVEPW